MLEGNLTPKSAATIPVPVVAAKSIKSVVADNMEVKIARSSNRKKTISGRLVNNIMQVNAPSDFPQEETG